MAKPNPPQIAPHEIPKRQENKFDEFLERLYFRIHNNVDQMNEGKINAQWVAFEALGAVLPALLNGFTHDDVKGAYPIASWRNETVEVPAEILHALVSAWNDYYANDKTLGQSFGFEKLNRQGARPMKESQRKIDEARKLSNAVLIAYIQIGDDDPKSLEKALMQVSEKYGVSERTAERAYKAHGRKTYETLKLFRNLDFIPGKTSRSTDVDG
jgi:hypothetical protein